jgi:hypothetical protein
MFLERKLKKALSQPEEMRMDALVNLAREVGCPISDLERLRGDDKVVVRQIRDAAKSRRDECLWLIALVSALASVLAAGAAWAAVLSRSSRPTVLSGPSASGGSLSSTPGAVSPAREVPLPSTARE